MANKRLFSLLLVALTLFVSACSGSGDNDQESSFGPGTSVTSTNGDAAETRTEPAAASELESSPPETLDEATVDTTTTEPPPPLPDIPGILYVSTTGVDTPGGGRFPEQPLRTPSFAVSESVAGDLIEIGSGTYGPLEIAEKRDLRLQPAPGALVTFTSNSYTEGAGLRIVDSESIIVTGLFFERLLWGIQVWSSEAVTLQENRVFDLGQEGISVSFDSSDIDILNNEVERTGRREGNDGRFDYRTFGEGIYLGTGATNPDGSVDQVNNVRIVGNTISQTTAEAIDVKASVFNVQILNNIIHDIDVASGGAITIGRGTREFNADVVVENNAIYKVTTWSPYTDGIAIRVSSTAEIRNNAIWDVAHRGILVDEEFRSIDAAGVQIADNLIFNVGIERVEVRPTGDVTTCGTTDGPEGLGFDPTTATTETIRALLAQLSNAPGC